MVLGDPYAFALSVILQEVANGLYALIGSHTALVVSLLLIQGVGVPGVALWFKNNHKNVIAKKITGSVYRHLIS